MMNNPMAQIMAAMQRGITPNQIAMRLAQQNPAVRQAMQFMNGKLPQQIQREVQQMAAQQGLSLNQIAHNLGIQLPK